MGKSVSKQPGEQKSPRTTQPTPSLDTRAGAHAIALDPPAYGIELADNQPAQAGAAPLQRQAQATEAGDTALGAPPNRTGLPDALKAGIETLSGLVLDDVRVRYNSPLPARLQALAYTQGSTIHVAPGQECHLPHEAWHVVQQKQGRVRATKQLKNGVAINDDAGLEREADVMGARAAIKQERTLPRVEAIKPLLSAPTNLQMKAQLANRPPMAEEPKSPPAKPQGKQLPDGVYPQNVMKKFHGKSDTQRYTKKGYPHLSIVFTHNNDGTVSIGQGCHYSIADGNNHNVDMDTAAYIGFPPANYPSPLELQGIVQAALQILQGAAEEFNEQSRRHAAQKMTGKVQAQENTNAGNIEKKVKSWLQGQQWHYNVYQQAAALGWTAEHVEAAWQEIKGLTKNKDERVAQLETATAYAGRAANQRLVQRKIRLMRGTWKYIPENNTRAEKSGTYVRNYREVDGMQQIITIEEIDNKGEEASLNFKRNGDSADIHIRTLNNNDPNYDDEYDDRIASLSHELQHAIDLFAFNLTGDPLRDFARQGGDKTKITSAMKIIHTEWRAWAVEAASDEELAWKKGDRDPKAPPILVAFLGPKEGLRDEKERIEWLTHQDSEFFSRTKKYLGDVLALTVGPTDGKVKAVLKNYESWLSEALAIFDQPKLSIGRQPAPDPLLD